MVNAFLCCSFKYSHILDVLLAILESLVRWDTAPQGSPRCGSGTSDLRTPTSARSETPDHPVLQEDPGQLALCWASQRMCFSTVSSFSTISIKIYNIFIAIGKAISALLPMPAATYPHIISSLVLSQPPVSCTTKDLRSEVGYNTSRLRGQGETKIIIKKKIN